MSKTEYHAELQAERRRIAFLYERLESARAEAAAALARAQRSGVDSLWERDVAVDHEEQEAARLRIADNGLCFGRLDVAGDERIYVGRIGLFDEENEYEPLLTDWRAPVSRPFYCATAVDPEGITRRRQFHALGHTLTGFTDEEFGGETALLAALNAPREDTMRDIVATIQAEQDEIIRLAHPGVLVIEGGPGTGKTAVALHRVAYLLYAQRQRLSKRGVLVVGPNSGFLRYIGRVLPSLGETDVVFATPGGLVPGLRTEVEEAPDVRRIKGSVAMVDLLAAAVANRQELPKEPIPIELDDVTIELDRELVAQGRARARASGLLHNPARAVFRDYVLPKLAARAVDKSGTGWLHRDEPMRSELIGYVLEELAENPRVQAELDALWPDLSPQQLLGDLYSSPERLAETGADPRLYRESSAAWTVSDVPLLDEAVELLGKDTTEDRRAERERRREAEYAAGVLEVMSMDELDEDGEILYAADVVGAQRLAERHSERDHRDLAERAAADREWTYGHVVVDEAQELSAMDWRVLMRRCPSRSFTIVGDLAQRWSSAGARSWDEMLSPYVTDRWRYRALTVNYRTPAEIMAVAARVLTEVDPAATPPESVRANGIQPTSKQVEDLNESVREAMTGESSIAVIVPEGLELDVETLTPRAAKGLEFDAVVLVEPARILANGSRGAADLYVALTRATQRLTVVHTEPLPAVLLGEGAPGVSLLRQLEVDEGLRADDPRDAADVVVEDLEEMVVVAADHLGE